jgi:ubiquitin carboxyl-terminal hydrolase 25/28
VQRHAAQTTKKIIRGFLTSRYYQLLLTVFCSYYASLGAIGDFSDSLILFAYKRQSAMDEVNVPYYLECLQDLAVGRDSIMLQTEVATLNSQGRPNRRDRDAAYRFLAIDPSHSHALSDDVIISTYRVRLPDISPSQREEARRQLRIIGESRDSFAIIQEAADTIDTYEQALSWLGLEHGQADDFVRTMYTIKVCQSVIGIHSARF